MAKKAPKLALLCGLRVGRRRLVASEKLFPSISKPMVAASVEPSLVVAAAHAVVGVVGTYTVWDLSHGVGKGGTSVRLRTIERRDICTRYLLCIGCH
jgi:hypothetical protein